MTYAGLFPISNHRDDKRGTLILLSRSQASSAIQQGWLSGRFPAVLPLTPNSVLRTGKLSRSRRATAGFVSTFNYSVVSFIGPHPSIRDSVKSYQDFTFGQLSHGGERVPGEGAAATWHSCEFTDVILRSLSEQRVGGS